jgi:hypothetical protein
MAVLAKTSVSGLEDVVLEITHSGVYRVQRGTFHKEFKDKTDAALEYWWHVQAVHIIARLNVFGDC